MAVKCPSCGAENRDKARFCTRCAGPLEPVFPAADAAAKRERAKKRSAKRKRKPGQNGDTSSGWAEQRAWLPVALLFAGALILFTVWLGWGSGDSQEASRSLMAETSVPKPAAEASPRQAASPANDRAAAVAISPALEKEAAEAAERLRQTVEKLRLEDEARSAEKARRRIEALESRERLQREEQARKKALATASRRTTNEAGTTGQEADAAPQSTAPAIAAVEAKMPDAPVARTGVRESCAGESNFFSRDLCHIDACKKPQNRQDPVCVQYREMERNGRYGNL